MNDESKKNELLTQMGYITREDFCTLFDIKISTEEAWRYRGICPPHYKVGKEIFYALEDAKRFMESRVRNRYAKDYI